MLKKAGIIVATAAVGMVAVSGMAFAQGTETDTQGNQSNACTFDQTGSTTETDATGGPSGLIGLLNLAANVVVPVTAQLQALDCNNVGVTEVNDTDSHNKSKTVTKIKAKDSFNDGDDD